MQNSISRYTHFAVEHSKRQCQFEFAICRLSGILQYREQLHVKTEKSR